MLLRATDFTDPEEKAAGSALLDSLIRSYQVHALVHTARCPSQCLTSPLNARGVMSRT